jgi:DNA-binding GntR family transcriptional regulator
MMGLCVGIAVDIVSEAHPPQPQFRPMPRSDQPRTTPPAAPTNRRGGRRPTTRPEASNIGLVRLQRQTVASMTLDAIRDGILHGQYTEGEPLRQDALADELGVSRIPIREALRQLETEGLVTFNPHRGAIVSSLSLEEIEEVFDLRASIESDLLRRAIPHLTTHQLDQADEVLDRYSVALRTGDVAKWGVLNWQFHASLYAPAARPVTMNIVQRLHQQSDRYLRMQLALTHGETRATEEHRAIAAAARAHDTKRACQLVRDHIAGAGRSLLAFLRERRDEDMNGRASTRARAARGEE